MSPHTDLRREPGRGFQWASQGMCLVELLVAMAAGAVVLAAAMQGLMHVQNRFDLQQRAMAQHQDARMGLAVLEEELRLAAAGLENESPIVAAGDHEVEFMANLDGRATVLTAGVSALERLLPVTDGLGWNSGKRVVVCGGDGCSEAALATDGDAHVLTLVAPLGRAFPAGSLVSVSNRIRYYLGTSTSSPFVLMRQVDGGANPLIADVRDMNFSYVDKQGRPTTDHRKVARVRLEVAMANQHGRIITEVGFYGR